MLTLTQLLIIGFSYLLVLFGIAFLAEKEVIPRRVSRHPAVYVLSLGVYASIWTFFGSFNFIHQSGLVFLASYLGATAAFILAPVVLIPIFNITNRHQLSSLADLFAFRFRSGSVGTLTSLLLLFASLPLLSIQIQAVTDSVDILYRNSSDSTTALIFCGAIALFAIIFGTRKPSLRARNSGLVAAIATGAFIKLLAFVGFAIYVYFEVLGGPSASSQWIESSHSASMLLEKRPESDSWRTLLLAFFASVIVMPHMFHLLFNENQSVSNLHTASWGVPLYLFILAAAVPVITWAGIKLAIPGNPSFIMFYISEVLESQWLIIATFIGALAAASGVMIVAVLSIASMLQNHIILPLISIPNNAHFYNWILWVRRALIVLVITISYLFFESYGVAKQLQLLGLSAFIAFLQFLPGLMVTLFWTRANKLGFITGLCIGILTWFISTFYPLVVSNSALLSDLDIGQFSWQSTAILSLILNVAALVAVSLLTQASAEERQAAESCLYNALERPSSLFLSPFNIDDIIKLLSPKIGEQAAHRELQKVIASLSLKEGQLKPLDLLRVRSLLEHNLSALIGPIKAASLLEPLSTKDDNSNFRTPDILMLEDQLENYQERMSGLASELDELRRHHRTTLQKLPLGVCTIDRQQRVIFWNLQMENLTQYPASKALGKSLPAIPAPWGPFLQKFALCNENHATDLTLEVNDHKHWLNLHKNQLSEGDDFSLVILLEDDSEQRILEEKLAHTARLASIGRFSAGVAHEIGNPVTGIACLAQNLSFETKDPIILETGEQILNQTKRISRIVKSLMRFAHTGQAAEDIAHSPIDLQSIIDEAIHLVALDSRGKQKMFHCEIATGTEVMGDSQQLIQVFINILNNACDASPEKGKISISCETHSEIITLKITDEGTGIDQQLIDKLFEPFFTTKDPGKGTGLGLSLVHNILTEHYGSIEIISPANKNQNNGTQVVITLPGLPSTIPNGASHGE
ncbi:histidine kinase ['Osedax' symbiont bacterium Rs2_46_30_T18]|nr:histidine kinase ['Osedax' symbiont bacterium Rs2_46_30_T18]